ncbi:MAG: hypothetical protein IT378_21745, partial [Sandaracinaceae bacterium]|nr:hypothetical protein [Sandaracinaceae bacterium]
MGSVDDPQAKRPLVIRLGCRPSTREVVVLVRTWVPDIAVRVDGRELARTDADGLAHVPLRARARSQIEVVLGTEHRPELTPSNPTRVFSVGDASDLFVHDQ